MSFSEQGTTINSERYVSTLRALKGRLRRVRQDKVKDVVIQHDNARPHTSRQTQCALQQLELPTIPHPPYSPDLAPSDFFLFPLLKKHLKGNHYETDAEVEADVRTCADPRHQNSSPTECENLYNAGASVLNAMVTMLKNDSSSDR